MGRYKSRPRLWTRHLKIRCFADGCKVLAERFVDAPLQPRLWYCKLHFDEKQKENYLEPTIP